MDRPIGRVIVKWTAWAVGYVIGSAVLAVLGSLLIDLAIAGDSLSSDAPENGLLWMFLAGLLFALALLVGLLLTAEIVYSRFFGDGRIRKLRLLLRILLGTSSLLGPCWILLVWPPEHYRTRGQSQSIEVLIDGLSIVLFLAALTIPFRFQRPAIKDNYRSSPDKGETLILR